MVGDSRVRVKERRRGASVLSRADGALVRAQTCTAESGTPRPRKARFAGALFSPAITAGNRELQRERLFCGNAGGHIAMHPCAIPPVFASFPILTRSLIEFFVFSSLRD